MNSKEILVNLRQQLQNRTDELSKYHSEYSKQEQDLLHFLENEQCDAVAMVRVAKELKQVRQRLRMVKIELDQLSSIRDAGAKAKIERMENKTYQYKTNALMHIAGRKQGQIIASFDKKKLN
jgi:hypothetical protein